MTLCRADFEVLKNIPTKDLPDARHEPVQRSRMVVGLNRPIGLLGGCYFYFHKPLHSVYPNSQVIAVMALKRLELESQMLAASSSSGLSREVTHVIIYAPAAAPMLFRRVCQSFQHSDRELLQSYDIKIVSHCWLERCITEKKKIDINPYLIRKESKILVKSCSKKRVTTFNDGEHLVPIHTHDMKCDIEGEDQCTRSQQYSELSHRGEPLKKRRMSKVNDILNANEKTLLVDSCCMSKDAPEELHQFDDTGVESTSRTPDALRFQLNGLQFPLKHSKLLWDSQCVQDIARLYLGCSQGTE